MDVSYSSEYQVNAIAGSEHSANSWHYQVIFKFFPTLISIKKILRCYMYETEIHI